MRQASASLGMPCLPGTKARAHARTRTYTHFACLSQSVIIDLPDNQASNIQNTCLDAFSILAYEYVLIFFIFYFFPWENPMGLPYHRALGEAYSFANRQI